MCRFGTCCNPFEFVTESKQGQLPFVLFFLCSSSPAFMYQAFFMFKHTHHVPDGFQPIIFFCEIRNIFFITYLCFFDCVTKSKFLSIFNFSLDSIDYITFGVLLLP